MANFQLPPWSIGSIIAVIILILVILLAILGRMPALEAGLLGGLALARLV
ncbi:MAG TPA: hypothetical protein VGX68_29465 [Thermoanaerobaculia bacterium]|jgi:hypothetical protein|nr:hypothetical protein [Thermoanaerobaculia bacterium]